jgi:hypothetical protein
VLGHKKLNGESESAQLFSAVIGNFIWTPWWHPHPIDFHIVGKWRKRLSSLIFNNILKWTGC